jgi:hypothetical protein
MQKMLNSCPYCISGRTLVTSNRYSRHIARLIYREAGKNEAYLTSRLSDLLDAEDYYDLAMFYKDRQDLDKAVKTAEQGLTMRFGTKDDLRVFLANYALEYHSDRKRYLELLYKNMLDCFTLESYQTFQGHCQPSEWSQYEPDILKRLNTQSIYTRFPILWHRQEKQAALEALLEVSEGTYFPDNTMLQYAKILEADYPEALLSFYQGFVNDERLSTGRPAYKKKAQLTVRIRKLYLEQLDQVKAWEQYRRTLKARNLRRVSFQEEFAACIPDWKHL